jgi:hypothetical protein
MRSRQKILPEDFYKHIIRIKPLSTLLLWLLLPTSFFKCNFLVPNHLTPLNCEVLEGIRSQTFSFLLSPTSIPESRAHQKAFS